MPSLKDLKTRISSVKSTQKITAAMKMVAAAKLRRAQENAEAARPYAEKMNQITAAIATSFFGIEGAPDMLVGKKSNKVYLLIVCTADRGLCGGFNSSIVREARRIVEDLTSRKKTAKLLCVGRKGRDNLKRTFASDIIDTYEGIGKQGVSFEEAIDIASRVADMFEAGEFDVCTILFNKFQSAMTQTTTPQQIIPFNNPETTAPEKPDNSGSDAVYIFEPDEEEILADLLPRNLSVQIFQALLESSASEHGARMTAMDNASRNANDMIDGLTLTYNRTRQAAITKELIEIISGAEAL